MQREYLEARTALRAAKRLRVSAEGPMLPALCTALLRSGQGRADEERCRLFLDGFQFITVLRRSELVLFSVCLKAACLQEIAAVCRSMPFSGEPDDSARALEALFGTLRLFSQLDPEELLTSADEALDAAIRTLLDEEHQLLKLFAPPFAEAERSPGYLTSYGPGVRENGGQYTHGAVRLALALHERGRRDEAARILRLLLPESHDGLRYEAEPFVLPADVSAAPGREEQAGWTWYTGSAGWYLRAARKVFPPLPNSDGM